MKYDVYVECFVKIRGYLVEDLIGWVGWEVMLNDEDLNLYKGKVVGG